MAGALYLLHQDFWFWRTARPLVFGFMPIGLFYHACYTVVVALLLWMLVRQAWPSHLEAESSVDSNLRSGSVDFSLRDSDGADSGVREKNTD